MSIAVILTPIEQKKAHVSRFGGTLYAVQQGLDAHVVSLRRE